MGPAGTGKSLAAIIFLVAAIKRRERAALFVFDEELGLLFSRMKGLGIDIDAMQRRGSLFIEQVDAAELSPGEFAHRVRNRVDDDCIKTVVIDSLNGYQAAMPEENSLILHMHELLQYLNRQGATTFMTVALTPSFCSAISRPAERWAELSPSSRSARDFMNRPSVSFVSAIRV